MKQFFHTHVLAILTLSFFASHQYVCAQASKDDEPLVSNVDHAIATIASVQFKALNEYLSKEFPKCWMSQDETKGFMLGRSNAYAEIWNSGVWYQYGFQVAFSSPKSDEAPMRAKKRFKSPGVQWGEKLFTVGSNGAVGHPVAGTFLVHPGGMRKLKKKDGRIDEFVELVTAIPNLRLVEKSNYRWFGMELEENKNGFTAVDKRGFKVTAINIDDKLVTYFGHVAMGFKLAEPVESPKEIAIPNSGGMKAIFKGDRFWLVLRPGLFNRLKAAKK